MGHQNNIREQHNLRKDKIINMESIRDSIVDLIIYNNDLTHFHKSHWTDAPLPHEIEKPKKKVIRANFKLFHLYVTTFSVGNIIFSAIFWAEKLKKKKKAFQIFDPPPPPYEFLDTPLLNTQKSSSFSCFRIQT